MTGSLSLMTSGMVRVSPGRLSLPRFERETAPLGKRVRVSGWRVWAQPLAPEPGHLYPRVEGGVATADGRPLLWVTVEDRLVTFRTPEGSPAILSSLLAAALITHVRVAMEEATQFVRRFYEALERAEASPNRRVRGAAVMARKLLRQGQPLTAGLMRAIWSADEPLFGTACMAVAERTRVNPGRVRIILTSDSAWWKHRGPDAPHWLDGLAKLTGYPKHIVHAVTMANRWWHHRRRRPTTPKAWRRPKH